ncbi:MAG: hypothetical protein Q9170_007862, partial [Blastenia crenularia]
QHCFMPPKSNLSLQTSKVPSFARSTQASRSKSPKRKSSLSSLSYPGISSNPFAAPNPFSGYQQYETESLASSQSPSTSDQTSPTDLPPPVLTEAGKLANPASFLTNSTPSIFTPPSTSSSLKPPKGLPKHKSKMGGTKIRPFKGLRDGKEDPEEYLEDLDWAYEQDYEDKEASYGDAVEKQQFKNKTFRILFRQNLEDKAAQWYKELDYTTKQNWDETKRKFQAYFILSPRDEQTKVFELRIKVATLAQEDNEQIASYLGRCDDLVLKIPTASVEIGMACLRGMKDPVKRERVSFECNKDSNYEYANVSRLIKAAYIEIGKISPFDPEYSNSMGISLPGATTTEEMLRQALVNTSAAFPAILQGLRSLNTAVTKGVAFKPANPNAITDSRKPRDLNLVQCYGCGEYGHYKGDCPHEQHGDQRQKAPRVTAHAVLPSHQHLHDESSEEDEAFIPARLALVQEPAWAMAAGQSNTKATGPKKILARPSGVQKSAAKGKQKENLPQHILDQIEAHQTQTQLADDQSEPEDMDFQEDDDKENEPSHIQERPNPGRAGGLVNQSSATLPKTRVSKTGKVQELVTDKPPKVPDPIKGMVGRKRFDVSQVFEMPITLPLGELLDRSDTTIKELAHYMQRATPRYRVKKSPTPAAQKAMQAENTPNNSVLMANAALMPPPITAFAYEDDGKSTPLMITSWVGNQKFAKTLLDGGSLVELIGKKKLNKIDPRPKIYGDGYIRVSLANDTLDTLTKYVKIPVNVQGVQATIKAWVVDVDVYDILLGLAWMRRVHCNPHYGLGKVTISGDDQKERNVPAALAPMEINLPTVEFDEDDEVSADQACQQLLDEQENLRGYQPACGFKTCPTPADSSIEALIELSDAPIHLILE